MYAKINQDQFNSVFERFAAYYFAVPDHAYVVRRRDSWYEALAHKHDLDTVKAALKAIIDRDVAAATKNPAHKMQCPPLGQVFVEIARRRGPDDAIFRHDCEVCDGRGIVTLHKCGDKYVTTAHRAAQTARGAIKSAGYAYACPCPNGRPYASERVLGDVSVPALDTFHEGLLA